MMQCPKRFAAFLFVFGAVVLAVPALAAAQPYVYPARGQSPQQQEFDRGQCYSWAVQQTGFDPSNPQVYSGPPPRQGALRAGCSGERRAARRWGRSAAPSAGTRARARRSEPPWAACSAPCAGPRWAEREQQQQASYAAQQQGAMAHGRANYNQAFGACMTGRGYSVS